MTSPAWRGRRVGAGKTDEISHPLSVFRLSVCHTIFPNRFKPDVLLTLSQTPTPGDKNIVGFIVLLFFFWKQKCLWMSSPRKQTESASART